MKKLPQNLSPYKKTPIFNSESIPKGLLNSHTAKEGTWGKICILKGQLDYIIETSPPEIVALDPDTFGVVEPQVPHHVEPKKDVEFYVEFYR